MNITSEKIHQKTINAFTPPPQITSFLIKVTARCNLNCDYCYVFNHADQSWKKMPSILSSDNRKMLAKRLGEYAKEQNLEECLILFHGGEPLLVGVERLLEIAQLIKNEMPVSTKLYFSMQTNGTLLNKERLDSLAKEGIGISLSLDGPETANDLHRLNSDGKSSFAQTLNAFKLLEQYPQTFTGMIGVIDPRNSPADILSFFADLNPPQLDFLLPDSNYITPPPLRDQNPNIYVDWLIEAFDLWYDHYPELRIRLFEGLLGTIAGLPSQTDAFGLGDISLLTIETDGFYHDLDVLKITEEGFSSLGMHLEDASISQAILSDKITKHRQLLSFEGLSATCKACPEVKVCGGGSVPHRYGKNGFDNPTIYCREMLSLISHIRRRLVESVNLQNEIKASPLPGFEDLDVLEYEKSSLENSELERVYHQWQSQCQKRFLKVVDYATSLDLELKEIAKEIINLPEDIIKKISTRPSTVLWMNVLEQSHQGLTVYNTEGKVVLEPDPGYLTYIYERRHQKGFEIHLNDYWLRCPFGSSIVFENEQQRDEGIKLVERSLYIIEKTNPALRREIELISPYIQFIQDSSAHPDQVVSFSDNIVPGVLYVGIRNSKGLIDPYDLADSIIHEFRHQKLYLLEQFIPVIKSDTPLIPSPWKNELRPVSGVFHGVFVFHQLKQYWEVLCESTTGILKDKAKNQMDFSGKSLAQAIQTLEGRPITEAGRKILDQFKILNANYF